MSKKKDKKRVLLIDDEQWFAEPIIRRIERLGYDVFYETNASDALRSINESFDDGNVFKVVIVDMMLPYGDDIPKEEQTEDIPGIFILKKLEDIKYEKILKFAYTALDDKYLVKHIENKGAKHYAKASVDDDELIEELIEIIND